MKLLKKKLLAFNDKFHRAGSNNSNNYKQPHDMLSMLVSLLLGQIDTIVILIRR